MERSRSVLVVFGFLGDRPENAEAMRRSDRDAATWIPPERPRTVPAARGPLTAPSTPAGIEQAS